MLRISSAVDYVLDDPTGGKGCPGAAPFTAAVWVRPNVQKGSQVIASAGDLRLWLTADVATLTVGLATDATTSVTLHTATWTPGVWTHVAVSVNANGFARGYIDGQPGKAIPLAVQVPAGKVHVGGKSSASTPGFIAYLGDLAWLYWGCSQSLRGTFAPSDWLGSKAYYLEKWSTSLTLSDSWPSTYASPPPPPPSGASWLPDGPYVSPTSFQIDCRIGQCQASGNLCSFESAPDGSRCWDGSACHTGQCVAGQCQNSTLSCDDGDPATQDVCEGGDCTHFAPAVGCAGDPTAAACAPCQAAGTIGWSCDTCKQAGKMGASCQASTPDDGAVVPGGTFAMGCDAESDAEAIAGAGFAPGYWSGKFEYQWGMSWCDLCDALTATTGPAWPTQVVLLPLAKFAACTQCQPGACTIYDKPAAQVVVPQSLLVKKHEVTRAEWLQLEPTDPSEAPTCATCPVTNINLYDAMHYANLRSMADGAVPCYDLAQCSGTVGVDFACTATSSASHCGWRLPSEAEWEHLARGTATGENTGPLAEVAWFEDNGQGDVKPVALQKPNSYGLFDVQGNVWEWTAGPVPKVPAMFGNWMTMWPIVPSKGPWCWPALGYWNVPFPVDNACPTPKAVNSDAVLRGCGAADSRLTCRLAYRYITFPSHRSAYAGLRLVRTIADM